MVFDTFNPCTATQLTLIKVHSSRRTLLQVNAPSTKGIPSRSPYAATYVCTYHTGEYECMLNDGFLYLALETTLPSLT